MVYAAIKQESPLTLLSRTIGGQKGENVVKVGAGSGISNISPSVSGNVAAAIAFAKQHIGDSYAFGAIGPAIWDCSSFVQAALAKAGVTIPRTTFEQVKGGNEVAYGDLAPGDLVFTRGLDESGNWVDYGHVQMYVGGGKTIQAANTRSGVIESLVPASGSVQAIRRYVSDPTGKVSLGSIFGSAGGGGGGSF